MRVMRAGGRARNSELWTFRNVHGIGSQKDFDAKVRGQWIWTLYCFKAFSAENRATLHKITMVSQLKTKVSSFKVCNSSSIKATMGKIKWLWSERDLSFDSRHYHQMALMWLYGKFKAVESFVNARGGWRLTKWNWCWVVLWTLIKVLLSCWRLSGCWMILSLTWRLVLNLVEEVRVD